MSEVESVSDTPEMPTGQFDLDPAKPQAIYDMLREHSPILRTELGGTMIARHEDVEFALRNADVFSSDMDAISIGNVRPLIPLQINPPEHVKYRRLLDPLFAPKQVALLENDVRKLSNQLIDDFIDTGECEFNSAFAIPLPCTVFLRLLGLPLEDLDLFLKFKDNIIRPGDQGDQEEYERIQAETGQQIYAYFDKVLDERQQQPRDDMLTGFLEADVDGNASPARTSSTSATCSCSRGSTRSPRRWAAWCRTSRSTPSSGNASSTTRRRSRARSRSCCDGRRRCRACPGSRPRTSSSAASESKPANGSRCCSARRTSTSTGSRSPTNVDFQRPANRHLAFGGGVHRCLGSHLARLELRVALEQLHERIPDYSIKPGEAPQYTMGIRAVEHLPLVFTPPS